MVYALATAAVLVALSAAFWFTNPFGMRDTLVARMIVNMRVAPARLDNPKTPADYGMDYQDVEFVTADGIRLSAWEIRAPSPSDRTIIVNHPLTTTRYGSVKGLDGVEAEFLPMVRHIRNAGYNVVMYDHRGQGESDGGLGSKSRGVEAPVGAGVTEWQDVVASLKYILSHPDFGDDEIIFLSQCMGANATFLAWQNEPELFANPRIRGLVANQPTISYNMTDRLQAFAAALAAPGLRRGSRCVAFAMAVSSSPEDAAAINASSTGSTSLSDLTNTALLVPSAAITRAP